MRLSMSGTHTGDEYGLGAVTGTDPTGGGVAEGSLLNEFAEALCARDEQRTEATRARILARLGEKALVDTAAVIAGFNGYPRVADATGIPLEDYKAEATAQMRVDLDLDTLDTGGKPPQPALRV